MKRREKKQNKFQIRLLVSLLFFTLCTVIVGTLLWFYATYGKTILQMQQDAKRLVAVTTWDTFTKRQTSIVYDCKGKIIATIGGGDEGYYIKYEQIPPHVIDAMVVIEDKRFFAHTGIDFIANIRAAIAWVQHEGQITQGASTITQQLARTIFLSNERTLERKIKEIFVASELEKKYSKQQILEFYLNNIYFGNGYYGIQAASLGYFDESIEKLTLSQIAYICAIPNNPTIYDPRTNEQNTYQRRNKILKQMYEDGRIQSKAYKAAVKQKIHLEERIQTSYNYVESYVYDCAVKMLLDTNRRDIQVGGYRIYTSIDLTKQERLQNYLDDTLSFEQEKNEEGVYELQGSAVCIENETGNVVAIVGGRSQMDSSYTLNRAYQSYRQPGSAIKPLIVYGPYLEQGHSLDELCQDIKMPDGPRNANGVYEGEITIRQAIVQSKNTVAWTILERLTPKRGISYLKEMNFLKITEQDDVLAASLGGFTYGTNTLEMAAGYATLANDGYYIEPNCILRITDAFGNELYRQQEKKVKKIYETYTTDSLTDALKEVLWNGTAKGLHIDIEDAAGKTGTSSNQKDGWFVGYTPYYTTSVWVGYDIPKTLVGLTGSTYPGYIWRDFMREVYNK